LDVSYLIGLFATVTFSVTGVLAARAHNMDLVGIIVVGVVTAVGGGTIRDMILAVPVFWVADANYLLAAVAAAVATFLARDRIQRRMQWLLYLDALGVAMFASLAVVKSLDLGLGAAPALVMGVITGIGGGIIRDLLTGRPTLIMSRDLYATPILFGVAVQLLLLRMPGVDPALATVIGGALIFGSRSAAVFLHWQMPDILTLPGGDS